MMQLLLIIILIMIAIWAWPVTVAIIVCSLMLRITRAIYRNHRRNTALPEIRKTLRDDRKVLIATMVGVIKKHWSALEDKFEQYIDEDDYGDTYVSRGLGREFAYFSERVVLPELQRCIDNNETGCKSVDAPLMGLCYYPVITSSGGVVFKENTHVLPANIKLDESNQSIANKLLAATQDGSIDDNLLYALYGKSIPKYLTEKRESASHAFMGSGLGGVELPIREELKVSEPILLYPFVATVFAVFYAMRNGATDKHMPKGRTEADFTGNDPYKYEAFIKDLLRARGFAARKTRGSGDFGVDVLASKGAKTFAIQCKLYNHPVGTKSVQEIVSGRIFYKTDYAVVVSDNSFTNAARVLARKSDVMLAHHKNLVHKMESLIPRDDDVSSDNISAETDGNQMNKELATNQEDTTLQNADELIAVVLPTISNDKM